MDQSNYESVFGELLSNANPTITDVMKGIAIMLMKMNAIHTDVTNSNQTLEKHKQEIEKIHNLATNNNIEINTLRGQINILKQQQIDSEVMLIGFQQKITATDETKIVQNIGVLYNIDAKSILNYYSYMPKNESGRMHFIVKFIDRNVQISFISKFISNGAPTQSQLLGLPSNTINDPVIMCFNRLTQINQNINRELRILKRGKHIHSIRYRNLCFEFKENENSQFTAVDTEEQMKVIKHMYNNSDDHDQRE